MDPKTAEFIFSLTVKKISDEYLELDHESMGVLEGCSRVYEFEDVFRSYRTSDIGKITELLNNPKWYVGFNHDEDSVVANSDLSDHSLAQEICLDEDWDDYEESEPVLHVLFQGDFYSSEEFDEEIEEHSLEEIYDDFKIIEVNAVLTKVNYDDSEYYAHDFSNLLNHLQ